MEKKITVIKGDGIGPEIVQKHRRSSTRLLKSSVISLFILISLWAAVL